MICVAKKTFTDNANRRDGGVIHGGVGKGINPLPRSMGSVGRREVWKRDVRHPLNAWPMGHGPADYIEHVGCSCASAAQIAQIVLGFDGLACQHHNNVPLFSEDIPVFYWME